MAQTWKHRAALGIAAVVAVIAVSVPAIAQDKLSVVSVNYPLHYLATRIGGELIEEIVAIYENFDFETEVLVASVRSPLHIQDAALIGADVATCPPKTLWQMMKHPLTDIGLEKFLADWEKVPKD